MLLLFVGGVILKYRKQVKDWTGSFMWAERYLGMGGTNVIIILLGLALIFLGSITPFGGLDAILYGNIQIEDPGNAIE
ncbi:MAG: hypothetical protein PHO80_01205 [Candidatus Gracilibacteria bacterium]|nr:hypothetical protein [Candidatus Gracilibacteria bacterium]